MLKINDKGKIVLNGTDLSILFVCTGNTCRSPMCEAVFNSMYGGDKVKARSAGIFADGSEISKNAVKALGDAGIEIDPGRKSRGIDEKLLEEADIVICVTHRHSLLLIQKYPKYAEKIAYMPSDITDPFGGDLDTYKKCLSDIKLSFEMIFDKEA